MPMQVKECGAHKNLAQVISDRTDTLLPEGKELETAPIRNQNTKTKPLHCLEKYAKNSENTKTNRLMS